jgi:hypothetical protein
MFASVRRYRLRQGPMEELARRVDAGMMVTGHGLT